MTFDNLKIKNIEYTVRYVPDVMNFTVRGRTNHIIGIQLSGIADNDFGYKLLTLRTDCIYFFNMRDNYDVRILEKGTAFSVHFTTYEPIETDSFCIPLDERTEVYRLLCKIEKQSLSGSSHHGLMADFYSLCNIFTQIKNRGYSAKDRRIHEIKTYLDGNFMHTGCLDKAAELCGISRRRFNDIFRDRFSVTPNRYLINRRTEYAKKLLRSKELGIEAVSRLCGFSDVYYFCRVFKQETGFTPGEYKNLQ